MYCTIRNILKTWCCIVLLSMPAFEGSAITRMVENSKDTINKIDSAGLKQGHWVITKNEATLEEGKYVNNIKEGIWTAYYQNDVIKSEITFTKGKAKGEAKFYYEDGILREYGNWQMDHWEGSYKFYYPSGELSYDWFYNEKGKREGKQTYFYSNGKTMYQGQWDNGRTEGALQVYNEQGILIQEKIFENGQFALIKEATVEPKKSTNTFSGTGLHTIYNLNGQIEEKGFFVKGSLFNGQKFHYNELGEKTTVINYKNGAVEGDK